ncbi:MAG TPA: hypothetical protein VF376_04590 [Thermoanaerobaculia bacterium]
MKVIPPLLGAVFSVLLTPGAGAQPAETPAGPEMERLARALAGKWNSIETMERSAEFPDGGSRQGVVEARLAAGGTTLVYEVHSDGTAGKLDGFLAFWWSPDAKLYDVFVCFNSPRHPCRMRGTAHWEGDLFVNDYDSAAGGKTTRWRDTFRFTLTTHTLLAAIDTGGGAMKTLIATEAKRQAAGAR